MYWGGNLILSKDKIDVNMNVQRICIFQKISEKEGVDSKNIRG
jgi:hypothetical protein